MENVVVIAATNRLQLIDEALLRSGRFDTKIAVHLPDEEERKGIIKVHLRHKKQLISVACIEAIAKMSVGMSGADLETITNESAYCCIERKADAIIDEDLISAAEKIFKQKYAQNALLFS